ncbi:MAG: amidohydrolase family protein [Gemmobacter sp.]
MLFDTHLHLVDRTRLRYPWLAGVPPLDRDWTLADYAARAAALGITGALHMEVDVAPDLIEAETAFVAGLMARPGSILRGAISSARPEEAGFADWLDRQDRAVVRGLRRVLHVVEDAVSQSPLFRQNVARLGPAGLPFDIVMLQRQLPLAGALADSCPGTTFVLDHCGVPDIVGDDFAGWAASITDLARRPNVNAKVSGITTYGGPDWTVAGLRPYVEHVIGAFGWNRVVWGSDSPVCNLHGSLERWVAATHELIAGVSDSERQALSEGNARRIWNLPAA